MLVTVEVKAPPCDAQGVKEAVAMCLEPLGDCRVVDVRESENEQLRLEGMN